MTIGAGVGAVSWKTEGVGRSATCVAGSTSHVEGSEQLAGGAACRAIACWAAAACWLMRSMFACGPAGEGAGITTSGTAGAETGGPRAMGWPAGTGGPSRGAVEAKPAAAGVSCSSVGARPSKGVGLQRAEPGPATAALEEAPTLIGWKRAPSTHVSGADPSHRFHTAPLPHHSSFPLPDSSAAYSDPSCMTALIVFSPVHVTGDMLPVGQWIWPPVIKK